MSTAAAWDSLPTEFPSRRPTAARPRLVVIEGGAESAASRPVVLWVPRWLRLALTLFVAAVLAIMVLGIGGAGAAPGPVGSVEIRSGQTLSEIAVTQMPGVPVAEAVARIQLANNLPSTHVTAGQVVVIPAS